MSQFVATCGPTGVGKTYQMERLIRRDASRFTAVLSVTTRPSRGPEDDRWYRFVTHDALSTFDPADIISDVEFRGEHYLWLRSELEAAASRAPIAFMAIVPSIILRFCALGIPHLLLNCHTSSRDEYATHLVRRGYQGDALQKEMDTGLAFVYPPADPVWPSADVFLGSDAEDDRRFEAALDTLLKQAV